MDKAVPEDELRGRPWTYSCHVTNELLFTRVGSTLLQEAGQTARVNALAFRKWFDKKMLDATYGRTVEIQAATKADEETENLIWGDVVDGIQCAVRSIKASFAPDEDVVADIVYRNAYDGPITVCIYPDPFYTWVHLYVKYPSNGMMLMVGQHANGSRRPLKVSDFVTLQPGQTASFRQAIAHAKNPKHQPEPGKYFLQAEINKINRMDKHILGLEAFCKTQGISKPWCSGIESGKTSVGITPQPATQPKELLFQDIQKTHSALAAQTRYVELSLLENISGGPISGSVTNRKQCILAGGDVALARIWFKADTAQPELVQERLSVGAVELNYEKHRNMAEVYRRNTQDIVPGRDFALAPLFVEAIIKRCELKGLTVGDKTLEVRLFDQQDIPENSRYITATFEASEPYRLLKLLIEPNEQERILWNYTDHQQVTDGIWFPRRLQEVMELTKGRIERELRALPDKTRSPVKQNRYKYTCT